MTKRGKAIGLKRRALFPGLEDAYQGPAVSTCKDVGSQSAKAIASLMRSGRCLPFRTDHGQYVFGNERPKRNLNKGAGLDVSPAVRDFLGLKPTDVTDWRFVEFSEVPRGPWSTHGENNTFVINDRQERQDACGKTGCNCALKTSDGLWQTNSGERAVFDSCRGSRVGCNSLIRRDTRPIP